MHALAQPKVLGVRRPASVPAFLVEHCGVFADAHALGRDLRECV